MVDQDFLADPDAERAVLGSMMLSGVAVDEVCGILSADDFVRGSNRTIFGAIAAMREDGAKIDLVTLADFLSRSGKIEDVGGPVELADISVAVPVPSSAGHYARIVADLSARRHGLAVLQRGISELSDLSKESDDSKAQIVDDLLAAGNLTSACVTVADVGDEVMAVRESGKTTRTVSTGWSDVDRCYRVLPGGLTIVTGTPGHGKSAWIQALAVNLAKLHDWQITIFSPEAAPLSSLVDDLVTTQVGRSAPLEKVGLALGWLHDHFRFIDDSFSTVGQILSQTSRMNAEKKVDLLVIDPWTEITSTQQKGEREDQFIVREVTRIRKWARKNDIAVVLVVHPKQMQRNLDGTTPVPRDSDLHGGSAWRKQADALIAVWRDEAGRTRPADLTDIYIQKIRRQPNDGKIGMAQLQFTQSTNTYQQVTKKEELI